MVGWFKRRRREPGPDQPHGHGQSMFALIFVAILLAFVIGAIVWYTVLLSQFDWCMRGIGASKVASEATRPEYAVRGCFDLLKLQVQALAMNSHMLVGTVAFGLAVLLVISVAKGRASASGPGGFGLDIGGDREAAAAGAQAAANAAQGEADALQAQAETPDTPPEGKAP